jgi:integrase
VTGLTVQRNIEDLRAALNHGEGERRFEAPKVPSVDKKLRVKAERPLASVKTLGALLAYSREDKEVHRELCLMLGTSCRPGVALAFDPKAQWDGEMIDLQPDARLLTDKRNAIVPMIEPLKPVLEDWAKSPHDSVASRKRWWRTARRALGVDLEAYDIRHAVTTMLDDSGVPGAQISGITGHLPESRGVARTTSKHYLHYDPRNALQAKRALTKVYRAVMAEADRWSADHLRTKPAYGQPITIARKLENA